VCVCVCVCVCMYERERERKREREREAEGTLPALMYMWEMSLSHRNVSFVCLIYVCVIDVMFVCVWHHVWVTWALIGWFEICANLHLYLLHRNDTRMVAWGVGWCVSLHDMSHISMSHMAHMEESCRVYECMISHICKSHAAHMDGICRTYARVMSHIRMSHVVHMNESCRSRCRSSTPSHIWMSHVVHMNESYCTCDWVISHMWMSHELCRTYERVTWDIWIVMSHTWMKHVARMHESCRIYEWAISHTWMSHVAHMNESRRTNE